MQDDRAETGPRAERRARLAESLHDAHRRPRIDGKPCLGERGGLGYEGRSRRGQAQKDFLRCLLAPTQREFRLASPRRRYPHHQPRSRAVQDARWQHSLTNNVFSIGSTLSLRAARAFASSRLQCVASFPHIRLGLAVRRRKPFARPRQRPHHHGLPTIAARNHARRFLAFAWCHSPFLARDWTCQTRTRRSVLTPFHVSTSPWRESVPG